jgi:hypothetical protein
MSCCGKVASHAIGGRIFYTILFFIFSILSWILRNWGEQILSWLPEFQYCNDGKCFGVLGVYRLGFAMSLFHFIQAPIMIGVKNEGDVRVKFQDGFWPLKLIGLVALCVASFFIPNKFFEIYGWIALVASGFFIIIQLILLVDFAHSWAESWIQKMQDHDGEESCNPWWWGLLSSASTLYIISVVGVICSFIFFCRDAAKCEKNVAFIVIDIVAAISITLLAIHPRVQAANPSSGILQSSVITAYSTYLVWSALMSEPESDGCNPFAMSASANNISLFLGAIITIVAVCYSTIRAAVTNPIESERTHLTKEEQKEKETEEKEAQEAGEEPLEVPEPVSYNFFYFHLIFALGALYVSMLMSDWYSVTPDGAKEVQVDTGTGSVWVKIVSGWVSILLYIWTLLGPVLFPDRDWGYNKDVI